MKVPPFLLMIFGIFTFLLAPLQAAFIQTIYFGRNDRFGSGGQTDFGNFTFQYQSGVSVLDGRNGSIDWMTWSIGTRYTEDLVRDGIVVPRCNFEFSFNTTTQQVQVGNIGFQPGYFITPLNGFFSELRYSTIADPDPGNSRAISLVEYFRVGEAQEVPESGSTGAMMLGSLFWLGMTGRKRTMREASGRSQ
jgi:hypothetical protein